MSELKGTIEHIVHYKEESGFVVMDVDVAGELVTVVGELLDPACGEEISARGEYVNHPTFGSQFKAELIDRTLPKSVQSIYKYLASGALKGIGPVMAKTLVDKFGAETLNVIELRWTELASIKGISKKKAEELHEQFMGKFGVRAIMAFFSAFEIDASYGVRLWKCFGGDSMEKIEQNPFVLCADEIGLDFKIADKIRESFDISEDDPRRIDAGVRFVLSHNLQNGHTCLPFSKALPVAAGVLDLPMEAVEAYAEQSEYKINEDFLALPDMAQSEKYIAERLGMLVKLQNPEPPDYTAEIRKTEKMLEVEFNTLQREAIQSSLTAGITVLTGGPGTGKTTTLKGMVTMFENQGIKPLLCAPTGRAAKRMSEVCGKEAKTIHRLLEVAFINGSHSFSKNSRDPLKADVVVVDELSMVDVPLFAALLDACKLTCRLVLIGDYDQLPSVSAGNILKDIIDSDCIPIIRLDEIFRQAAESYIVLNSHKIIHGDYPEVDNESDFFILNQREPIAARKAICQLVETRIPKAFGLDPMQDIQVLTPSRKGAVGTVSLNASLQQVLNPPSPEKAELVFNGVTYREGDKVMQIRNNYDLTWSKGDEQGAGVYNGDIGFIGKIDRKKRTTIIDFDGRQVEYEAETLRELELAYAVTVHKSQGSEFSAVILAFCDFSPLLYYRNLLYTAVTRARKLLVAVTSEELLSAAIGNDRKMLRYTRLRRYLEEELRDEPL